MNCHAAAGVSRGVVSVRAASRGQAPRQPTKDRERKQRGDLPESGFFSLADPKREKSTRDILRFWAVAGMLASF